MATDSLSVFTHGNIDEGNGRAIQSHGYVRFPWKRRAVAKTNVFSGTTKKAAAAASEQDDSDQIVVPGHVYAPDYFNNPDFAAPPLPEGQVMLRRLTTLPNDALLAFDDAILRQIHPSYKETEEGKQCVIIFNIIWLGHNYVMIQNDNVCAICMTIFRCSSNLTEKTQLQGNQVYYGNLCKGAAQYVFVGY